MPPIQFTFQKWREVVLILATGKTDVSVAYIWAQLPWKNVLLIDSRHINIIINSM